MSNIYPSAKGISIWQYVSIDLIEIRNAKDGPERYILSAICGFSKAIELVPLKHKIAAKVS